MASRMIHGVQAAAMLSLLLALGLIFANRSHGADADAEVDVAALDLTLRRWVKPDAQKAHYVRVLEQQQWQASETAIVVCDMWDAHHSINATKRVAELAPRMNEVLTKAREMGVLIIHAPSSTVDKHYADHPARRRVANVPQADNLPTGIHAWCRSLGEHEKQVYPIDQTDGGIDDIPSERAKWHEQLRERGRMKKKVSAWAKQIETLSIDSEKDYITDKGVEVWNIQEHHGIKNVILMGVHTNMCVLGRPFGLRQMAKNGRNVVLMRDMTDTMYNPRCKPYVGHFSGTDLIIEHIEKLVCPTITSGQILKDGKVFRFEGDTRKRLLVIADEGEYHTLRTLPKYAAEYLGHEFRVSFASPAANKKTGFQGLDALAEADILLVAVRRRTMPLNQLQQLKAFVALGKPVVGIRTASHAFNLRPPQKPSNGHSQWPEFDAEVLGGHYTKHHGNKGAKGPFTYIRGFEDAKSHPVMAGVPFEEFKVRSWLYKVLPLGENTEVLMMGRVADRTPHEPVAWTNKTSHGGRVFYTSLGHPEDFEMPAFQRLLLNGIHWAAQLPMPTELQTGEQRASAWKTENNWKNNWGPKDKPGKQGATPRAN